MTLADIDLVEMHEAFAAQVACNLQAFASPEFAKKARPRARRSARSTATRLNVNGGSIALGHPFGATGARIVTQALDELKRREQEHGALHRLRRRRPRRRGRPGACVMAMS